MSQRRQRTNTNTNTNKNKNTNTKDYNDAYERTSSSRKEKEEKNEILDLDIGINSKVLDNINTMTHRINSKANEIIRDNRKINNRNRNCFRNRNGNKNNKDKNQNSNNLKPDYSDDWNKCITKSVSSNIDNYHYLELLAATLTGLKQKTCPNIPPPEPTLLNQDVNNSNENNNDISIINRFSILNIIENEEDEDDSESDDEGDNNSATVVVVSSNSTQVRYLLFKFLLNIAELHYKKSDQLLSTKFWVECAYELELAYQLLNNLVVKNGEWWAALSVYEDEGTVLDNHNMTELKSIIAAFDADKDCASTQREKSKGKLEFKLKMVREKLDPMLVERDIVKESYGVERWTSNPRPKMDYAAKRAQWVEDEKKLLQAIGIIEPLQFI